MKSVNATMNRVEWLFLVILSVLWGASYFYNAVALRSFRPFTLVALRLTLAAPILHLVIRASRHRTPRDMKTWGAFFVMGLLNNALPFSLISWGQTSIPSGLASILIATTPLFTVVAAHFATKDEKINAGRLAGVGAGMAGVVLIIGPEAIRGLGSGVIGSLAVVAAAASYALAGVYGRRFREMGTSPLVTAAGMITASAILMIPLVLIVDRPWNLPPPTGPAWAAIGASALLATVIPYILYFRILESAGATNVLLVTFLLPVTAILLGAVVLGEEIEAIHIAGFLLIGVGLAAIDGRIAGRLRKVFTAPRRGAGKKGERE